MSDRLSPRLPHALTTVGAGLVLALSACKSTQPESSASASAPARAQIENEYTASAEVVAVERTNRILTLRREDGDLAVVQVGPAARNFGEIEVGDTVRVRFKESLAALRLQPHESLLPSVGALGAGRAEAGAKPGAAVGAAASVRVRIESLDLGHDIVVGSLASGELVAHRLATPEGRAFAKGLKVGDLVQLDYGVALALTVEEL